MIVSNDCSWHNHLEHINTKAWTRINLMRKLKFKLDRRSLQTIYIFIRPLLEYADVVWDYCNQTEAHELEKNTSRSCANRHRFNKLISINALLSETGWGNLAARRKTHKLQLFFKMVNALSPEYLASLVPPTVGSLTPYPLRNATNIQTIHTLLDCIIIPFCHPVFEIGTNSLRKCATQLLSIPLNAS